MFKIKSEENTASVKPIHFHKSLQISFRKAVDFHFFSIYLFYVFAHFMQQMSLEY